MPVTANGEKKTKKRIENIEAITIGKRKNDPSFRMRLNLSRRIKHALKGIGKLSKTMDLLGCSIEEFKKYLEKSFKPEMSWDNYGYRTWHTDHIKPCALFDLTDPEEQKKCFHYTNLQPLWATTKIARAHGDFESIGNQNKSDKYHE